MKLYTDQHHTRVSAMRHEKEDKEIEITNEDWDEIMTAHRTKVTKTILKIINKYESE